MNQNKKYHAFISYSHKDKAYASIIQRSIETLGLPFYKRWQTDVSIFRDERKIPLADSLTEQILNGLKESNFLIVIASKNSADSNWVKEEIINWHNLNKDQNGFISNFNFILIDDVIEWDYLNHDFDKLKTTALPKFEERFFKSPPIWANLQLYCKANKVQTKNPNYEWEIAKIKGLLLGKMPDEIINEAAKGRKTFRIITSVIIFILLCLTIYSYVQKQEAISQKNIANENSIKNQNTLGINAEILSRNENTLNIALSSAVDASSQIEKETPGKLLGVQEGLTSVVSRFNERIPIIVSSSAQSFDFIDSSNKVICADLSGHITVYNTKSGEREQIMGDGAREAGVFSDKRFNGGQSSPNEKFYLGKLMGNGIQIWDIKNESKLIDIAIPPNFNAIGKYATLDFTPICYQFSNDSKFLIASLPVSVKIVQGKGTFKNSAWQGTTCVGVWNLETGKMDFELGVPNEIITSVSFSPSGKLIAIGTLDGNVFLYETASRLLTAKIANSIENKNYSINQLEFLNDSSIVAGGNDGYLNVWHISNTKKIELSLKRKVANSIENQPERDDDKDSKQIEPFFFKVSPKKNSILTLNNGDCHLLQLNSNLDYKLLNINNESIYVEDAIFSRDGVLIATTSSKVLRIWDATQGFFLKQVNFANRDIERVKFLPTRGQYTVVMDDHGDLLTWTFSGGNFIKILRGDPSYIYNAEHWKSNVHYGWNGNERSVDYCKVAVSSDGKKLAAVTEMGVVHILNPNGEIISTLNDYSIDKNSPIFFTNSNKYVLTKTLDDSLLICDVITGNVIRSLKINREVIPNNSFNVLADGQTEAFAISPDGVTIAIAQENLITKKGRDELTQTEWELNKSYTIQLINVSTGKVLKVLKGHSKRVRDLTFSTDGKLLASCGEDSTVRIWNLVQGYTSTILKGHNNTIWHISFSNDSKKLISASSDSTAIIWDITRGVIEKHLKTSTSVLNAKFSKNSNNCILISGHRISIWNTSTGVELYRFVIHDESSVVNAEFLDEQKLVSVGKDGALKIYPMSLNSWHRKALEFKNTYLNN